MAKALRPVGYEDRLSLVEHLTELRTRMVICLAVFLGAFAVCFWQNDFVLKTVNRPLEQTAFKKGAKSQDPFEKAQAFTALQRIYFQKAEAFFAAQARLADDPDLRRTARAAQEAADRAAKGAPEAQARKPITLGVGEPFTATFKIAGYAALLLALPLILYQAYAFVLPAFSPREREVAVPLMAMVPVLFVGGVVFAYFVVLPNAIDFLQNFNDDSFDILLQAKDYYRFSVLVMAVMGLLFQIPVGILALTRLEILTVAQLRANRRYAILVIAIAAMLLPGTDPVTMILSMAPLLVLFEGSILLAALLSRRSRRQADLLEAAEADEDEESEQLPVPTDET